MALSFNSNGYLVAGMHCCGITEFRNFYVEQFKESATRYRIFNNFITVIKILADVGLENVKLWIDGSYTINKLNPGDIDFACL